MQEQRSAFHDTSIEFYNIIKALHNVSSYEFYEMMLAAWPSSFYLDNRGQQSIAYHPCEPSSKPGWWPSDWRPSLKTAAEGTPHFHCSVLRLYSDTRITKPCPAVVEETRLSCLRMSTLISAHSKKRSLKIARHVWNAPESCNCFQRQQPALLSSNTAT